MTKDPAKPSCGKLSRLESDDNLAHDEGGEELYLRPGCWPRRRRSRKNPTDLEIWKTELRGKVRADSKGNKVKLSHRDVLESLFLKKPMKGTPEQKMLALIELLEELHPSPSPTFATILDLHMEPSTDSREA